jgi:excisionase family DNA binding protein
MIPNSKLREAIVSVYGRQNAFAKEIGRSSAFVSQVVNGHVNQMNAGHGRLTCKLRHSDASASMTPSTAAVPARQLLTVAEAGRVLGVSERSVYRWVESDSLPAVRFGTTIRIPRPAVLELLRGSSTA